MRAVPRGGGRRPHPPQRWPVWSKGGEEGLFPGREESERRSFAGARQFADKPEDEKDGEKEEAEKKFIFPQLRNLG